MRRIRLTARFKQRIFMALLLGTLTVIFFASLMVPAVRARTYVIRDGERTLTYTTFATDPVAVLGEVGMELGENDSYTTEPLENGEAIHVRRAQVVTVMYHGQTTRVSSQGETAGELLYRLGLEVSGEDVVSHGMDEKTFDGMILRVDRVVTVDEIFTTTLHHEVIYCQDASVPEGMEEVLTQGVDGELLCSAAVTYVNGKEVSRDVYDQTVTKAPVTEIIGVGTGTAVAAADIQAAPIIGDGYILLPTGERLSYSGTDTIRATAYTHTDAGCDFITATGTTVHQGTVAVDPRFIPYGTRMFIVSNDGAYVCGVCVAEDCGGDIKGDRMDIYFPTYDECRQFGRRVCTIYYLC